MIYCYKRLLSESEPVCCKNTVNMARFHLFGRDQTDENSKVISQNAITICSHPNIFKGKIVLEDDDRPNQARYAINPYRLIHEGISKTLIRSTLWETHRQYRPANLKGYGQRPGGTESSVRNVGMGMSISLRTVFPGAGVSRGSLMCFTCFNSPLSFHDKAFLSRVQ